MNEKSAELGLKHTHFSNASRSLFTQAEFLHCKGYSTICRYALNKYPVFQGTCGQSSFTMAPTDYHPEGTYIVSHDYMINEFHRLLLHQLPRV
ncbi:hypothetical protein [Ruminococcus albus]|uniref:hypothetical protein n=1 Tax=Ruminococcus albus TaxID=1264 RepID=UPI0004B1BAC6|nr:hypothetical protein [Ruminococcus albus]